MWLLPLTAWARMTPNSNILCEKLWKSGQFKPHLLPGTPQNTDPCSAEPQKGLWVSQCSGEACCKTSATFCTFLILICGLWMEVHISSSKQTPFYHFSLPETPPTYSSHPPRRPSTTLGSSIGSSVPVLTAELSLSFLLKPFNSGWLKETFCVQYWKKSNQTESFTWWGCCWESWHFSVLGEGGELLVQMQWISGRITALTLSSRGWILK